MNGDSRARGTERTEVERSGVFERARQNRGGWQSVRERETRAGRVPCTVCHLAISWPTTRSQHEAFYEWAEAIIEALDWMKTLPMSSPCIPPTASARRQWRSSVATLEVANACAVIFFLSLSNVLSLHVVHASFHAVGNFFVRSPHRGFDVPFRVLSIEFKAYLSRTFTRHQRVSGHTG